MYGVHLIAAMVAVILYMLIRSYEVNT